MNYASFRNVFLLVSFVLLHLLYNDGALQILDQVPGDEETWTPETSREERLSVFNLSTESQRILRPLTFMVVEKVKRSRTKERSSSLTRD